MSVCRPARCLFQASKSAAFLRPPPARSFHQTSVRRARKRRPHYPSLKHDELKRLEEQAAENFPRYTEAQWKGLAHQFSPEQIEVIKLAEEAIDPKDLYTQMQMNDNLWGLDYADDLSRIHPFLDKQPKVELTGEQPRHYIYEEEHEWRRDYAEKKAQYAFGEASPLTTEEMIQSILNSAKADDRAKLVAQKLRLWIGTDKETVGRGILQQLTQKLEIAMSDSAGDYGSDGMDDGDYMSRLGLDLSDEWMLLKSGDKDALLRTEHDPKYSALAPAIPKFDDPSLHYPAAEESDSKAAAMQRLSLMTGRPIAELKRIRTKQLVWNRVVNQTRMGKIPSFYILTVAGDGNGLLGIGEGKSAEIPDASIQATVKALRNLAPVLRYEARTIFGELKGKVGATEVELSARPPGFGVRCQSLIFEMARCAGIHDLAGRVTRARNPMNTVKAVYQALMKQKHPDDIARARGRKLVDVRKVYYAGNVL